MRLNWFRKLGNFAYERAKTVFEHVFEQYEESTPAPTHVHIPSPEPREDDVDFLMSLATVPDIPAEASGLNVASEWERYVALGLIMQRDVMDNPLVWWKVCVLFPFISLLLIFILLRLTLTNILLLLELPETI